MKTRRCVCIDAELMYGRHEPPDVVVPAPAGSHARNRCDWFAGGHLCCVVRTSNATDTRHIARQLGPDLRRDDDGGVGRCWWSYVRGLM